MNQLDDANRTDDDDLHPDERWMTIGIVCLLVFELTFLTVIMLVVGATPTTVAIVIAMAAAGTIGSLAVVTWVLWRPQQRRYPPQPIGANAVSQNWQSFAFGMIARFNYCLRITADEQHLHVHPFAVLRWFGARRISIAWERISNVRSSFWPGMMRGELDGRTILGPDWCMKLAL